MPHGALHQVANDVGVANSYVTAVMNGTVAPKSIAAQKKLRRVQVALSRKLGMRVDEVFGGEAAAAEDHTPGFAVPA